MPLVLHGLTFEMGHQLSRLKNECTRNWQTERGEESNGKWHKLARVNSPVILQGWKIRALPGELEKDEGGGTAKRTERTENTCVYDEYV